MADENSKRSILNGWIKHILTPIIVAGLLAIPALIIMYADVDSLKTKARDLQVKQDAHALAIARSDEKFDAIKELLKEIRDEQKEIKKELEKKKDK